MNFSGVELVAAGFCFIVVGEFTPVVFWPWLVGIMLICFGLFRILTS